MRKNLTISLIVLLVLSGIRLFAQDALIKENRPVGSFSGIKISGVAHVYLNKAETEKVNIEVNSKEYSDRLIVEVVDNILVIRMNQSDKAHNNLKNINLKIYVDYRTLNSIKASGVTHIYSQNVIKTEKMDLQTSGVTEAKLDIQAKELDLESSGASNITLSGTTNILNIKSSGASNIKAYELSAQEVSSQASGASNILITVAKTLKVKASGASNINYKGNPQVTSNETSIASHVRKMQ